MKSVKIRKLVGYCGAALMVAIIIAGFIFDREPAWPGWTRLSVDMAVFWGGLGIGFLSVQIGLGSDS